MGLGMLGVLIRTDVPLPASAVRQLTKGLMHENLHVRTVMMPLAEKYVYYSMLLISNITFFIIVICSSYF